MPRKSSLNESPKAAKVDELHAKGWSLDKIAARLNIPRSQVQRYLEGKGRAPAEWSRPPVPDTEGKSSREVAEAHARWVKACLQAASEGGAPIKELAALSGQYTSALRHAARLDGSLEITAAQILRSTDFQRLLGAFKRAAGDRRDVWMAWESEVKRLLGEA